MAQFKGGFITQSFCTTYVWCVYFLRNQGIWPQNRCPVIWKFLQFAHSVWDTSDASGSSSGRLGFGPTYFCLLALKLLLEKGGIALAISPRSIKYTTWSITKLSPNIHTLVSIIDIVQAPYMQHLYLGKISWWCYILFHRQKHTALGVIPPLTVTSRPWLSWSVDTLYSWMLQTGHLGSNVFHWFWGVDIIQYLNFWLKYIFKGIFKSKLKCLNLLCEEKHLLWSKLFNRWPLYILK